MAESSKMYFDEATAQRLFKEYMSTVVIQNKCVVCKDVKIENELMAMIKKIVIAIINNYRYYIFEEYEDLIQEGLKACYIALPRYTPEKGSLFNYASIVSKIHLLNYTDRRKKHRNHLDVDEQLEIESQEILNFNLFIDNLRGSMFSIIDENFVRAKRKKYYKISVVIVDYLEKSKKVINKSDLYAWARSYGIKSQDVRLFIKDIGAFEIL